MESLIECASCGSLISGKARYCRMCLKQVAQLAPAMLPADKHRADVEPGSFLPQVVKVVGLTAFAMSFILFVIVRFM